MRFEIFDIKEVKNAVSATWERLLFYFLFLYI